MEKRLDEVSERFLRELETKGISGYKLMKDGVIGSQTTMTNIRQGRQSVSPRIIDACVKLYGVDKAYILLGDYISSDEANDGNSESQSSPLVEPLKLYLRENLVSVPFVPQYATASFIENLGDMQRMKLDTYGVMQEDGEDLMNGDYVVFQVKGESMSPCIPDSTKVLAKRIDKSKWDEASGVVFVAYGKFLTVKRILKNDFYKDGSIILKADNLSYGQIDISKSDVRGLWSAERIVSQKII